MKIKDIAEISMASLILMAYGWYLGGLLQSGPDIAGILLFITGAAGLILAFIIHHFTKRFSWHNRWYANILNGLISCIIIFILIWVFARLHG
jgi:multisubunit Na+/H+ antiporter MnhB subunit